MNIFHICLHKNKHIAIESQIYKHVRVQNTIKNRNKHKKVKTFETGKLS